MLDISPSFVLLINVFNCITATETLLSVQPMAHLGVDLLNHLGKRVGK